MADAKEPLCIVQASAITSEVEAAIVAFASPAQVTVTTQQAAAPAGSPTAGSQGRKCARRCLPHFRLTCTGVQCMAQTKEVHVICSMHSGDVRLLAGCCSRRSPRSRPRCTSASALRPRPAALSRRPSRWLWSPAAALSLIPPQQTGLPLRGPGSDRPHPTASHAACAHAWAVGRFGRDPGLAPCLRTCMHRLQGPQH